MCAQSCPWRRRRSRRRRDSALDLESLEFALVAPFLQQAVESIDAWRVSACAQSCARRAFIVVVAGRAGFEKCAIVDLQLRYQIDPGVLCFLRRLHGLALAVLRFL